MRKLKNEELNRHTPESYKALKKWQVSLVLDDIRSMHNVGSAFRTADAFALEHLYLCGITAQPPHREIQKTALGATETVEWSYHKQVEELVGQLKATHEVICLEQTDASICLTEYTPPADRPLVLIFGNEVFGVNDAVVKQAHQCLEIPQFGTKHSFNVSVSIGIALWDMYLKKPD
jgi:tRNA G18 (ribose-2'-O)-methylase SpoU